MKPRVLLKTSSIDVKNKLILIIQILKKIHMVIKVHFKIVITNILFISAFTNSIKNKTVF